MWNIFQQGIKSFTFTSLFNPFCCMVCFLTFLTFYICTVIIISVIERVDLLVLVVLFHDECVNYILAQSYMR